MTKPKMMIRPAGEGRYPLSQAGFITEGGLVWLEYAMIDGEPMTGTITQEKAERNGITIVDKPKDWA